MSCNVTVLARERLLTVGRWAKGQGASAVRLQETRHPPDGWCWAALVVKEWGWRIQWSAAPGLDPAGRRLPGGTAILWDAKLGRGSKIPYTTHRCVGRVWGEFAVTSCYGSATVADLDWLRETVRELDATLPECKVAAGDFNWKPGYQCAAAWGWGAAPVIPTTKESAIAAPTRCLLKGGVGEAEAWSGDLPGVPHHRAVAYKVGVSPILAPARTRLKRAAKYHWEVPPTEVEVERLKDLAAEWPTGLENQASLEEAWGS